MPKAMIEVAGRPYLDHLAVRLLDAGVRPVVIAVHHHDEMIRAHLGADRRWADLVFVRTRQQGTGADLLACLRHVPTEAFVVWNGDTVVDPNEGAFYVADDGVVRASLEASPPPTVPETFAWRGSSAGVLVLPKSLLAAFGSASPLSLERTVLPGLISAGRLRAFDNGTRYFLDFGTPAGLEQLHRDQFVFS